MKKEKNDKKCKAEFIRFLKEHNAFSCFVKNFNNHTEIKLREKWCNNSNCCFRIKPNSSFKDYFDKCVMKQELLKFAFSWVNTKEGFHFWSELSDEWSLKVNFF